MKFHDEDDIKRNTTALLQTLSKEKGIRPVENSQEYVLNIKGTIFKKINISFIVHFCHGKSSFSLDTFWTNCLDERKAESEGRKNE